MKRILEGLALFQREAYPRHRELFERLARNQTPQAVFVACSDSRVVPNMITQSEPGDLFIVRNVGNAVPPAGNAYGGTTAALEYAVVALGLRDVIICGHSNCGAMRGVLHPESLEEMPAVRQWVSHAEPARKAVLAAHPGASDDALVDALVDLNVIAQVKNVLTFPFVASRVAAGTLRVHGWVYDISTGRVKGLDASGERFVPLGVDEAPRGSGRLAALEGDEGFWERL